MRQQERYKGIAALLCILLVVGACTSNPSDEELHAAQQKTKAPPSDTSSVVRGPQKAQSCTLENTEISAPREELPPSIDTECTWELNGKIIGQSGNVVVVNRARTRNGHATRQLAGYDARNGALVWEGETVTFKEEVQGMYETSSDADARVLINGEKSYAVLLSNTVNTETEISQTTLRFYPVHSTGQITGAVYRAEKGFAPSTSKTALSSLNVPMAARVLLLKGTGEAAQYMIVNPETANAQSLPLDVEKDKVRGVWALAAGSMLARYEVAADAQHPSGSQKAYAVYGPNGEVQWRTPDVAPGGAAPKEAYIAGTIAGSYGEQVVIWWRKGTYSGSHRAWRARDAIVALHDAGTGAVIATQEVSYSGTTVTPLAPALSPDGRFISSENVVFDRAESNVHTVLPRGITLTHVTDAGVGYGRDHAKGADDAIAVTLTSGEITWRSRRYDVLPAASSEGSLIFPAGDAERCVAFPTH